MHRGFFSVFAFYASAVAVTLAFFLSPRVARAEQGSHTVPVAVLTLESDDAEDQAEAFSAALRSRVRASQAWSLVDTTQSLGMLTAALRCPPKPTPDCEQRIGDQIKAERYVWGTLAKGPTKGEVTAEIHLYQRGKSPTVLKETWADNLKDQNDDTLRKVAQRVLARLGTTVIGAIVVRTSESSGEIVIDGEKHVPLKDGDARFELAAGSHAIEVTAGNRLTKRTVLVEPGKELLVDMRTAPVAAPEAPEKPFPTRKVIGGISLGVGVVLGAVAVQQLVAYGDFQSRGDEVALRVPSGEAPCAANGDKEFCDLDGKAKTSSAIAIASGAVGAVAIGAGLYLLFTDGGSAEGPRAGREREAKRVRVAPSIGVNSGGFVLTGGF